MLQSYSWSAFFLSSAGLVLIWYLGLAFTVYRKESISFFTSSREGPLLIPNATGESTQKDTDDQQAAKLPQVIGKPRLAAGLLASGSSELGFASPHGGADIGLKSDLIAELKEIFTLLADNDGTKSDFIELIAAMKDRYPPIAPHPACAEINAFIKAHAPFLLSLEELENLWD
jgi:hypothetical protein